MLAVDNLEDTENKREKGNTHTFNTETNILNLIGTFPYFSL